MEESQHPFDLAPHGILRFSGTSPVSVYLMQDFLASLDTAYANLAYYADRVELAVRVAPELDNPDYRTRAWQIRRHDEGHFRREGLSFIRAVGIQSAHSLEIYRVELHSPGFWEILGSLNPLAQVRGYLQERHERKKDREYKNDAERRRLSAEARLKELEVQRAELAVARERYELAAQILGVDDARKLALASLDDLGNANVWSHGLAPNAQIEAAPDAA